MAAGSNSPGKAHARRGERSVHHTAHGQHNHTKQRGNAVMALGNAVLVRHRLAGECGGLLQQGLHAACQIIAVELLGQRDSTM